MKLLIVDDHPAMRALLREMTAALATDIRECDSAEQALQACSEFRPDCVIMDLRLPGMGGLQAIQRLRQLQPGVQVIAVTRFDHPNVRARTLAAGAHHFFPKQHLLGLRDCLGVRGASGFGAMS